MSAPPTGTRRRPPVHPVLLAAILLGVVVRVLYWLSARDLSLFQQPTGDAATYVFLAAEMARDGFAAPLGEPYHYAPLYPFFIWTMATLGWGITGVRAVQFLLGVAGVPLLWILGKRVGGRIGGAVAALGAAVYGPFVFFESELLSISLAVFFLELALVLWGRRRWAVVTGLLIGLAALAQPNFLLAGLLAGGIALIAPARLGWGGRKAVLLLVAGLLLAPGATLVRNLAVSGEPVLISTNGGINFFVGNNPAADGTFHLPRGSGLLNRPEGLFTSAREVAEEESGRTLSDGEVDRHWWLKGVDFWITDPGRALGVTLAKILLALNRAEVPSHYDYTYFTDRVPLLRFLPTMGWLFPLGGVGLVLLLRRRRTTLPLLFAALLFSVVPFFITGRYRLPLAILLLPAAGLLVQEVWHRRRDLGRLAWMGGAVAAYGILAFFPLYSGGTTRAHMLNLEGSTLIEQGELEEARETLEEALEVDPSHPEVLNNLAYLYELEGDVNTALSYYRQAVNANPLQAETYFNIESLYRKAGRHQEALDALARLEQARQGRVEDVAGKLAYHRGVNVLRLGDTAMATELIGEAVERSPDDPAAWLTLSTLYRKLGRNEEGLEAAERAAALLPGSSEVVKNHARSLEENGKLEEAISMYARAAAQEPRNRELGYRLGRLLVRAGRSEEAEHHLLVANQGSPHPDALFELARLYEAEGRTEEAITAYLALVQIESAHAEEARERVKAIRRATAKR